MLGLSQDLVTFSKQREIYKNSRMRFHSPCLALLPLPFGLEHQAHKTKE